MSPEEVGPGSIYNLSSLELHNIYDGITSTAFQRYDRTFYALDAIGHRHLGIQCLLPAGSCYTRWSGLASSLVVLTQLATIDTTIKLWLL